MNSDDERQEDEENRDNVVFAVETEDWGWVGAVLDAQRPV